ncbi:MAG: GAF domain-containing protein, partial [Nakamurella sp.]
MSASGQHRPPAPYRRRPTEVDDPVSLTRRPAASGNGPADLPVSVVAESVREAIARSTPAESMQAVLDMAVQTGPCDAASITFLGSGSVIQTIAASDERVRRADELQYETGGGPCLDAVWTDGVFIVPDLLADGRWPEWAPRAAELGIGSSISVHLFTNAALGSLNLYSLAPRGFTDTDIENARVIAAQAS